MIFAVLCLALLYACALTFVIAYVRHGRSDSKTPTLAPDDQELLWSALDEVQLLRLLRDAAP